MPAGVGYADAFEKIIVLSKRDPAVLQLAHDCRGDAMPMSSEIQARAEDACEKAGEAAYEAARDCA